VSLAAAPAAARSHPRHLVLFALVAGLLLGPISPAATLAAAAAAAALAGWSAEAAGPAAATGRGVAAGPAVTAIAWRGGAVRLGLAVVAAAAVLAGAVVADVRGAALAGGRLAALEGRALSGRAVVLEPIKERPRGPAVARVRLLDGRAAGAGAVLRARPAAHAGAWPGVGEIVAFRGEVAPLGLYDAYQQRRGAEAALEVAWVRPAGRRGGAAGAVDAVRRRAEAGLERGLPRPEAALVRGMVLGQDERLSEAVREDFKASGLAHLLAVSGQNVMLLATLVLAVGALFGLDLRLRLGLALALVALYVPLTGAGPSIQRAGVMGAAGLVAALAGRPSSRWYALGLAGAVTLVANPRAAGEPGWQLSFVAVAALLVLAPPLRAALARHVPEPVAEVAAITIAATVGTAPLLAFHFEQVSLASLPANLVAAPAVAPIMWLGSLAAAAAQVSPGLAAPLNGLNAPLLAFLEWVAATAAAVPGAVLPVRLAGPGALVAAYALLGAAVLAGRALARRAIARRAAMGRTGWHGRPALAAVAVLAGVAAVLVALRQAEPSRAARPAPGELVVSFLDVGQGDATLLQRAGASVLVDTGPPGGPILRRLAEAGVGRLDALVITHAQADHEGMALAVMRAHAPRLVIDGGAGWPTPVQRALPAALRHAHARRMPAQAGQTIALGGMRIRVLWPPPPGPGFVPEGDPNDRAVVAHVQVGAFDLLLPADAESNVTAALDLPPAEALKVAHHGSADPGLPALLERVQPKLAAIEVGRGNSYGHPAPSTLAALRTVDRVVRTDRDGTVRLHVRGAQMTVAG
jgi:competence protein ComEC